MEKCLEKQSDFVSSSSQTAVDDSEQEKKKQKKKKKGYSSDGGSTQKKAQKSGLSDWFKERAAWKEFIRRHRKDVKESTFVVDDAAPVLNISSIYDAEVLKVIWNGLRVAFNNNQNVVKQIYETSILPGRTETFSYNYSVPLSSNYTVRKQFAKSIEKQNKFLAQRLQTTVTRMTTVKEYAEEWKTHEAIVENTSQFPLWSKIKKKKAAVEIPPPIHYFKQHITEKSAKYPDKRPRNPEGFERGRVLQLKPSTVLKKTNDFHDWNKLKVFLEISIKNVGVVGRMVAMLYSDYVPMTVKNFLTFCDSKAPLTYKGNFFYLIFPNYYCQTGDVVENRGFGGTSIYGPYFGNEDSTLSHSERGVLTMYSQIPNRNGSQFLIIFRKLESLDGQNVVFGKIVRGLHVLDTIEGVGSKKTGRPKVEIYISDCDEI